jgi:phage portal protein BeeE
MKLKNLRDALGRFRTAGPGTEPARESERKTAPDAGMSMLPYNGSLGAGFGSAFGGMQRPALPRATPANLRRFAETPVARRAINCIKDRIAAMEWRLEVKASAASQGAGGDVSERMAALQQALRSPNASDSFRTLLEQVLEDVLVCGAGAIEIDGESVEALRLYPVDATTIEIDPRWSGDAGTPRYAQRLGVGGAGSVSNTKTLLRDDELMYVRLNTRTYTPFGLGKLEVAFDSISQLLEAGRYAARLANNGVAQYALWTGERTPEQQDRLIRWWQDDVEGSGSVPMMSSSQKPEVLRFAAGNDADLRLSWQEFLLRMIANAFDLPAMLLGVEHDVNRSTAAELADESFQTAVAPLAKLVAEHLTRDVIGKRLGWDDVRFVWCDLETRDPAAEIAMQTQLLAAGVLTVNEVRAMRGLGPL